MEECKINLWISCYICTCIAAKENELDCVSTEMDDVLAVSFRSPVMFYNLQVVVCPRVTGL